MARPAVVRHSAVLAPRFRSRRASEEIRTAHSEEDRASEAVRIVRSAEGSAAQATLGLPAIAQPLAEAATSRLGRTLHRAGIRRTQVPRPAVRAVKETTRCLAEDLSSE